MRYLPSYILLFENTVQNLQSIIQTSTIRVYGVSVVTAGQGGWQIELADINIYVGSQENIAGQEEPGDFTLPSTATKAFPKLLTLRTVRAMYCDPTDCFIYCIHLLDLHMLNKTRRLVINSVQTSCNVFCTVLAIQLNCQLPV